MTIPTFFSCFFAVICSLTSFAQDYTGVWEGEFATDMIPRLGRRTFFMHMELKVEGKHISGMFYNKSSEAHDLKHVVYRISGELSTKNKAIFRLTNSGVIDDNLPQGVADVFLDFFCNYYSNDSTEIIHGIWYPNGQTSPRSDGAGGPFLVKRISKKLSSAGKETFDYDFKKANPTKQLEEMNTVEVQKNYWQRNDTLIQTIISPVNQVSLLLYDNAIIDGDIISLYVNDSLVLSKKRLSTNPITYNLILEPNKHYKISLFAENLGSIPPNTAYMFIGFSKREGKDIYLSCDENQNVSVVIKLKDL